jgi:hypothetical protein
MRSVSSFEGAPPRAGDGRARGIGAAVVHGVRSEGGARKRRAGYAARCIGSPRSRMRVR